jgi:glycosyltransferase involved in cell wall biosynthesis
MVAVTVGLPFRNAHDSLADAIRSVFAQTFGDWELILVDDGSTDGSLEIARRVRDPRVRLLSDGENRGLPRRLNEIVDASRGGLIARLDADDMMHPDRLARQTTLLGQRPEVDFVGTACFTLDARDRLLRIIASAPVRVDPYHVLRHGLLAHATLVFRREWSLANRYNERFPRAEDRELYCRTLKTAHFAHIPEALYFVGYRKAAVAALRDYVETSRDNRRIFFEYAPRFTGRLSLIPLVLESIAKETAFRAMTAIGQQSALLRRRGRPVTPDESRRATAALQSIRSAPVQGLEGLG